MSLRKKRILSIVVLVLILIEVSTIFLMYKSLINYEKPININLNNLNENTFAILLEQANGSYKEQNTWPVDGYTYDSEKSGCVDKDGNILKNALSFNNDTNVATVNTNDTTYCYLYFNIIPILLSGLDFNNAIPSDTTKVIFTDEVAPDGVELIDVSELQNGSIVAWQDDTTYKISSQRTGKNIIANQDSSRMFYEIKSLEYVDVTKLDTKYVTSMKEMFYKTGFNYSIETFSILGLSNWDTSNVTDMSYMFYGAGANVSTWDIGNLSNWNTKNVTNMSFMFCIAGRYSSVFVIDLSNWDTSNVTDMSYMFDDAGNDATTWSLGNLTNWNVSNVTDMSAMFAGSGGATTNSTIGNLSNWDVSNVTNMSEMFSGCLVSSSSIGNISNWDVSNVTDMSAMFAGGGGATTNWTLDLSNWDVSNVTNMDSMFFVVGMDSKSFTMDLSNWDVSNVTNMYNMFYEAGYNATTFSIGDISRWNTMNVTNMQQMFFATAGNANWSLNLSNWNVSKVVNYSYFNSHVESKVTAPKWVN